MDFDDLTPKRFAADIISNNLQSNKSIRKNFYGDDQKNGVTFNGPP